MEKKLEIGYYKYTIDQLPADEKLLVIEAQAALKKAYAKYSGFHVGAAVRLASGKILHGANSESEVFPSWLCAERVLLYNLQINHADDPIVAFAIASAPAERECYPCGSCRQTLLDAQKRQQSPIRIIMSSAESATVVDSAEELLPFSFKL